MSSNSITINIPYHYIPRSYQLPFWQAMESGITRAVKVWHRRSGKDKTDLNFAIASMLRRKGTYYHLFPTYAQGKKVIWDATDKTGFPVLGHFPSPLIKSKNETELQIELTTGSVYQIIGTDNIDRIVGTNPVGVIYSEYSLQNDAADLMLRPILVENGGWAIYNFTPRGKNHAYRLYEMAKNNPKWYCSLLTIDHTVDENGQPVVTHAQVRDEYTELIARGWAASDAETYLQQEYFCSFESVRQGGYYTDQLRAAHAQGRITDVPWRSNEPVYTFWDLGMGDSTAIWFGQKHGLRMLFIDYYENSGEAIGHYAKVLQAKPYTYARHYWPHDGRNRDFGGTGEARRDTGERLGIRPIDIVTRSNDVDDGIQAVRSLFPQCWFDATKCQRGLECLGAYHKEYDEIRKEYKQKPYHDWSSHAADAFRTMAKSRWEIPPQPSMPRPVAPSFMSA